MLLSFFFLILFSNSSTSIGVNKKGLWARMTGCSSTDGSKGAASEGL